MSEIEDHQRSDQNLTSRTTLALHHERLQAPTGVLKNVLSALPPERAEEITSIIEVLREARPEFINSFLANAEKSIEQYISEILSTATVPSLRLQRAFTSAITRHSPDLDGASLIRKLKKGVLIDTSGHCGLLGDTESIHSLLLLGLAARARGDSHIFAFAGGGVPLSNSTFPAGYYWNGQRVSLHPQKIAGKSSSRMMVSSVEACALKNVLQTSPKYKGEFDQHGFPSSIEAIPEERRRFAEFLLQAVSQPESPLRELFTDQNLRFCDQVAQINQSLWAQLNAANNGLPNLAYGLIEDVNQDVLKEIILKESGRPPEQSQEPLYRILFDNDLRNQVLEALNTQEQEGPVVQGAWRHDEQRNVWYGTHLFWLLEGTPSTDPITGKQSVKNARQSRLSISADGILSNEDDTFRVEITPRTIQELLDGVVIDSNHAVKVVPGTFLNILVLTLENASIIGGMNQADYASTYQRILGPILSEVVPCEAVDNFRRLTLDNFCLGLLFTNVNGKEGSFEHLIHSPDELVAEVNKNARTMSVGEAGILDIANWINTIIPKAEFPEKLLGKVVEVDLGNGRTAWQIDPRFSFSSLYQEMQSVTSSKAL